MTVEFRGIFPATATPLTVDGTAVDESALRSLVDWQIESGADGLVPCGSTGEFAFLSNAERKQVIEVIVDQVAGRVPVVPQVGAMSTAEAVDLAKHAKATGADGLMAVAPYYEPLTWDETRGFFSDLGAATDLPIMVYNLPMATGVRLGLEQMTTLVEEIPTVKAVKDTSGEFALDAQLIHNLGDRVSVFVGWDPLLFGALMEGAAGTVIGTGNIIPGPLCSLYDAIAANDIDEARALWSTIYPVLEAVATAPYNAAIKAGMELVGHSGGPLRAPQKPLGASEREVLALSLKPFLN